MPHVNYSEILDALGDLTARERVELLPLATDRPPFLSYPPIEKYLHDLLHLAKAAMGRRHPLFTQSGKHDRLGAL